MVDASKTSLTKPEVYETRRIQLTSPILHIGAAISRLNSFEYGQMADRVYLPNQEALAKALKERGRLQDYIRRIEDREDITPLLVDTFGDRWPTASSTSGEPIFPESTSSFKWTSQGIKALRPMIRNGFGQLYIPGSSIKGAIRTAIAYYLLQYPDTHRVPPALQAKQIETKLGEKLEQLRRDEQRRTIKPEEKKKRLAGKEYMSKLFSDFSPLKYNGREFDCGNESNSDFMRAIRVTDSDPLLATEENKNIPIVAEVITSSFTVDGDKRVSKRSATNYYVQMVWNIETEFTLSIDTRILKWFEDEQKIQIPIKLKTVKGLIEICEEFAKAQWQHEQQYWGRITDHPNDPSLNFSPIRTLYAKICDYSLRLGWASGMIGTTIDLKFEESTRASIRNACGKFTNSSEAPKSRRTVVDTCGNIKYAPGWVKFEVL